MGNDSQKKTSSGFSVTLTVKGLGNVPSFKNTKSIGRRRSKAGKMVPFIMTDPKKKQWMEKAINQLECQLHGLFPIRDGETDGEWRKRLQTVLWQLSDDSLKEMLPGEQNLKQVAKGEEGAIVRIDWT